MWKFLKRLYSVGGTRRNQDEKSDKTQLAVIPVATSEARDSDSSFTPSRANLEGLPVEIQSAILLSIQDVLSLRNLTRASPEYHSAYLSQRLQVLNRTLFNSIGLDVLYDALFAISSRKALTTNPRDRVTRVKKFLSDYHDSRGTWDSPEHLDLESAFKLTQLQIRVQHATEDLCQTALSSHPFPGNQAEDSGQLSSNECRRFYRAFYRFEMFCNLFRNWKDSPDERDLSDALSASDDSTSELDSMEKSSRFLSLFKPWEVEELACVRDFFCNYYRRMLLKFEPEIRNRRPNVDLSEDGNCSYLILRRDLTRSRSVAPREHRIPHVARPAFLSENESFSTKQADALSLLRT